MSVISSLLFILATSAGVRAQLKLSRTYDKDNFFDQFFFRDVSDVNREDPILSHKMAPGNPRAKASRLTCSKTSESLLPEADQRQRTYQRLCRVCQQGGGDELGSGRGARRPSLHRRRQQRPRVHQRRHRQEGRAPGVQADV